MAVVHVAHRDHGERSGHRHRRMEKHWDESSAHTNGRSRHFGAGGDRSVSRGNVRKLKVEGSVLGRAADRLVLATPSRWPVSRRVARGLLGFAIVVMVAANSKVLFAQQATSAPSQTSAAAESKLRLQDRTFQSKSLGRAMTYRILLPAGYSEDAKKYPVLYLLHGWHGDYQNWSTLTKLTRYAEDLPILIVMPDAGNSWYVDSATVSQDKF